MYANLKKKTAKLSVISNSLLIILKLSVGIITNSVSIISEAIHSSIDLVAAIIAFFSVRISGTPADKEHPFGHGKIENVSGVIEAILIFIASGWIIFEAVKKIANPEEATSLGLGSLVMLISAGVNMYVSHRLYIVAHKTDSVALEADALHLRTDVLTSLGVAIGLFLIVITKVHILDPIIAIVVACFIIRESVVLLLKAFNPLLDTAISTEEIEKVERILAEMNVSYHDLRTRGAGSQRFIEFHLDAPPGETIENVHRQCDEIEKRLDSEFMDVTVLIHPEPNNQ